MLFVYPALLYAIKKRYALPAVKQVVDVIPILVKFVVLGAFAD